MKKIVKMFTSNQGYVHPTTANKFRAETPLPAVQTPFVPQRQTAEDLANEQALMVTKF
jgi:hypothetical protein